MVLCPAVSAGRRPARVKAFFHVCSLSVGSVGSVASVVISICLIRFHV